MIDNWFSKGIFYICMLVLLFQFLLLLHYVQETNLRFQAVNQRDEASCLNLWKAIKETF